MATLLGTAAMLPAACNAFHIPALGAFARPPELVGEWIDVEKTTPADTSLWVLGADGYDGTAHLVVRQIDGGATRVVRTEKRYASWYLDGALSDSLHRALCFARRLGRDGPTCFAFSLDSVASPGGLERRLVLLGYRGEHHASNRALIARQPATP